MNSGNGNVFSLRISESRQLTKEELDFDDDEEENDDFQFGFHAVATSKPKKQVGKII